MTGVYAANRLREQTGTGRRTSPTKPAGARQLAPLRRLNPLTSSQVSSLNTAQLGAMKTTTIGELKDYLIEKGISCRPSHE